jgi:hypothetical protein
MSNNLTPSEQEQARQIWDLLEHDSLEPDGLNGLEELREAPENVRLAVVQASRIDKVGLEPKQNPFA